jgi:hypothetical protein
MGEMEARDGAGIGNLTQRKIVVEIALDDEKSPVGQRHDGFRAIAAQSCQLRPVAA